MKKMMILVVFNNKFELLYFYILFIMEFYKELIRINNTELLNNLQYKYNNHDINQYYKENNICFRIKSNNSIQYKFPQYKSLIKYIDYTFK